MFEETDDTKYVDKLLFIYFLFFANYWNPTSDV